MTLDISKAFDRVWHAGFLHKLGSYGISGQIFGLISFILFSVINSFKWFWMENLHKNIHLILEFLNAPFLVLHFSYYTLTTFLMMLSVILGLTFSSKLNWGSNIIFIAKTAPRKMEL